MTTALEGGEWSAACPGRTLPTVKTRYPFYRRLGGPRGWAGRAENLVPTGIWSRTIQPVVSRYTDWATRPTNKRGTVWNIKSVSFICTIDFSFYMFPAHTMSASVWSFKCSFFIDILHGALAPPPPASYQSIYCSQKRFYFISFSEEYCFVGWSARYH